MTSFAERRRETHRFVGATMLGMCLAAVVWLIVGGALLQHVSLTAARPDSDTSLVLLAIALSVAWLSFLLFRASRGRLVPEAAAEGAAFGLVIGTVLIIAAFGIVRFYPTLP